MNVSKEFWTRLYIENVHLMVGVCQRYVNDLQLAEDLAHDAFLAAMNKADTYCGKGCIEAWLRKICVNTALMYLRTKKRNRDFHKDLCHETEDLNMEITKNENARSVIEQADFTDAELLEVIHDLPEHHRTVFNLYVIENYSHGEIAKELDISAGTSKSHLARARKKIQFLLHQKAIGQVPKKEKKKKVLMLLFLFPLKANYIDLIFKKRFSNFAPSAPFNADSFLKSIRWENVDLPQKRRMPFFFHYRYWLMLGICGFFAIYFSIPKHQVSKHAKIADTFPVAKENSMHNNQVKKGIISEDSHKSDDPVVLEKVIVQRKTIVVKDTVHIIDSTDVQ